ncbi:MAG: ubiquitin-like small modifier protein 1 [Phycisphaeraceae bacterium JB051]
MTTTSTIIPVAIPTALRGQVDGQSQLEIPGESVKAVLESINTQYPDLGKRLFKTEGELNRFINIYVNDEDIRFLDNLDTQLKAGDELAIVPAIAGG